MKFIQTIFRQLLLISAVALAPTFVLASEVSFVNASVLDPTLPKHSSYYLDALGVFPWWVTEVPRNLHSVSLADRLYIPNLAILYLISFILVAVVWVLVRASLNAVAFLRRIA